MPWPSHISDALIDEYALGRLNEQQAAELEEHLLICRLWQDRLRLTDDFIQSLRAIERERNG